MPIFGTPLGRKFSSFWAPWPLMGPRCGPLGPSWGPEASKGDPKRLQEDPTVAKMIPKVPKKLPNPCQNVPTEAQSAKNHPKIRPRSGQNEQKGPPSVDRNGTKKLPPRGAFLQVKRIFWKKTMNKFQKAILEEAIKCHPGFCLKKSYIPGHLL